jgi:DMSO/TMAO reductase YedYZ molybdopterin-dependent catalytic subunit
MSYRQSLSRRRFLQSAASQNPRQREEIQIGPSTPGNDQNRQEIRPVPPIHPDYWSFTVDILGEPCLILSYADMLALPASDIVSTLICSGNATPRIDMAVWRGVPILTLLDRLNIRGRYARFVAADGYVTGIQVEALTHTMLVYAMNSQPLSHDHGFPARLFAPGLYGYKMPKWITRMELTDVAPIGFWEARGWPTSGVIPTSATIISPLHRETIRGSVDIQGNAYAGGRGISQIEVNIDDGPWMPVAFDPAPPYSLTAWHIQWTPPANGDYLIKVRAFDGTSHHEMPPDRAIVVRVIEVHG